MVKSLHSYTDMNIWMGDDLDFYEECLIDLSDEQLKQFFRENPEFMEEYHMYEDRLLLLKDKNYREILRKIKRKSEQPTVKE